jgi:hypothetical protein
VLLFTALRSGSDEAVSYGGLIVASRGRKGRLKRTRTERCSYARLFAGRIGGVAGGLKRGWITVTSYRRRPGFSITILPWKVTRDEASDHVAGLGYLEIKTCNEGYLIEQKRSANGTTVAQATVGGDDLFAHLFIVPLNPRGLLVTLCRSTSTCVGALKFPLTRLTSGRGLVCESARPFGDVDVVVGGGPFSKLLIELRLPSSRSATPSLVVMQGAYLVADSAAQPVLLPIASSPNWPSSAQSSSLCIRPRSSCDKMELHWPPQRSCS